MVTLSTRIERRGDASLIELVLENDAPVPRRIRVANRLDGPVWPPRSEGIPADGWDDGGFEGVVGPGERLGLGYASPAPPTDPPAEIAWSERAAESEYSRSLSAASDPPQIHRIERADAEGVVRALGDPRPPRDVIVSPDEGSSDHEQPSGEPQSVEPGGASRSCAAPPEAVEVWFDSIAVRVERGERLAEPSSLLDGASAVEQEGSLRAVEDLVAQLESDAEDLRRVERRAGALATRAEDAAEQVPLATFRRLS